MFKKLSKLFKKCEHDFHIVDTYYKSYPNYDIGRIEVSEKYILFCPKCDKEKRVNADEYRLKNKKEEVKRVYGRD
jgi:hypothetical protein